MDLLTFLIQEAMTKDGFVIYKSFYAPIQSLSDESLGKLFRAIFEYQIHGVCVELPVELTMAFNFFKTKFESDNIKYEAIVHRNKENGRKGGRPLKEDTNNENPKNPMGFLEPKKADKDKDKDKIGEDKENKEERDKSLSKKDANDTDAINEFVERMYALYPSKCPQRNKYLGKSIKDKKKIKSLLKQYSMEDIEFVIRNEINEKYGKAYMQNFSTFLNNFPDPTQIDGYKPETKTSLPNGWTQERYDAYLRMGYEISDDGRIFKNGIEYK